jgi:hypothetical protein
LVRGIGKWGCSGIGKCVLAYILPILSHPEGWVTPGNRKRSPLERIDAGRRGGSHHGWPCRLPAEEEPKPPSSPELESSPPLTPLALLEQASSSQQSPPPPAPLALLEQASSSPRRLQLQCRESQPCRRLRCSSNCCVLPEPSSPAVPEPPLTSQRPRTCCCEAALTDAGCRSHRMLVGQHLRKCWG